MTANDVSYELSPEQIEGARRALARQRQLLPSRIRGQLKKAAKYRRYRLKDCLIDPSWRGHSLASIVQTRKNPEGRFMLVALLVDLGCLGPKACSFHTDLGPADCDDYLARYAPGHVKCDPHLAAKIVERGSLLGASLGFKIPSDCFPAMLMFEDFDPAQSDEDVPLGKDGKPYYMAGPHDDVQAIMEHLRNQVGEGEFHFFVPFDGL